jgi:hypothetical protein
LATSVCSAKVYLSGVGSLVPPLTLNLEEEGPRVVWVLFLEPQGPAVLLDNGPRKPLHDTAAVLED